MKLLKLYGWIAGSQADFLKPFKENENLYKQATVFWNKLESNSSIILLICVFLGILMASYYYSTYNNKPGRHYTPKHWVIMLLVTFILVFAVTFIFEYFAVEPRINSSIMLEAKIALGNSIYAVIVYFITSIVWCNTRRK